VRANAAPAPKAPSNGQRNGPMRYPLVFKTLAVCARARFRPPANTAPCAPPFHLQSLEALFPAPPNRNKRRSLWSSLQVKTGFPNLP